MAFPLQDTKCHQIACDVVHLRPLGARLTATQAELILTDANNLFNVGARAIQATYLCGRQRQAVGGRVLLAVSDHQHFEPSAQPADLSPVGVPPMLTGRVAIKPAVFLQTANELPPVVPNPLQQRLRRIPGIKQPILRSTAQAITGLAEQLQGQRILRRSAATPKATAYRDAQEPIRPDQPHEGQTIDGLALLAGIHPGKALDRRRKGRGKHRVIDDEIAPLAGEERAPGQLQECLPRPVSLSPSRQAVMGNGCQGLRQGHTTHGCAIIEQRGEVEPNPLWHRVLSFVMVGRELYSISPLLRNAC
jgi:hypothetical protein